ncbi:DUF4328 domain-containing protein [Streptomyces sp. NPDC005485]|uniref:DUF4328 domain-containing protein n=1 Tax=Streptomyces sp. NPDC005485 TaxID=3155591 RepID=UPI0033BFB024
MICARCQQFGAIPGGSLCERCAPPATVQYPPLDAGQAAWLRSPVGLGKAVAVLLGVVAAADLFAVWVDIDRYGVMAKVLDGEVGAAVRREASRSDTLSSAAGIAQTSALIATIVVFLFWFQRTRVNAEVFNPFEHRMKRGWTCWSWFVPVVNLWFPRRIMVDIWDASSPAGTRSSHGLVNAWWTLWIVSLLADRASFTVNRNAETAQEIQDATLQTMFADVADIAAAVLAVLVVLRLTRMQNEKAQHGPVSVGV